MAKAKSKLPRLLVLLGLAVAVMVVAKMYWRYLRPEINQVVTSAEWVSDTMPMESTCYLKDVQCFREPCPPILVCPPSPLPTTTSVPAPSCIPVPECMAIYPPTCKVALPQGRAFCPIVSPVPTPTPSSPGVIADFRASRPCGPTHFGMYVYTCKDNATPPFTLNGCISIKDAMSKALEYCPRKQQYL